jgi:glycosyltransferase involved in cell wall biosynthesis
LPEALLSAKRFGTLPDFDVDVVCIQPAGTAIRVDSSLDDYVSARFGRIERIELPFALRLLAGRKTSAILQVPGLFHIINRKAFRTAMRLAPERYAAIVTWSQWHSIHLVGFALKKRFPKLPWIAHFSDPWADNPFAHQGRILKSYVRNLEAKVYGSADLLSLTSREAIDLMFSGARAAYRAKTVELPHAFEPELYPPTPPRLSGPFMLRSLGNFYGARSPEPLFRGLSILRQRAPALFDQIRVEAIGSIAASFHDSPALRGLPQGVVRLLPSVDYKTSLALMRSADLLLNIDAPFELSVFLPSKLVDYIGAERPILGITPPGTASRVIREVGGWVAAPDDPEAIAAALELALKAVENSRGAPWGDPVIRRFYATSTIAEKFSGLIRRVVAARAPPK